MMTQSPSLMYTMVKFQYPVYNIERSSIASAFEEIFLSYYRFYSKRDSGSKYPTEAIHLPHLSGQRTPMPSLLAVFYTSSPLKS